MGQNEDRDADDVVPDPRDATGAISPDDINLQDVLPGRVVWLGKGEKRRRIMVYPIGLHQIKEFTAAINDLADTLTTAAVMPKGALANLTTDEVFKVIAKAVLPLLIPKMGGKLADLVDSCCKPKMSEFKPTFPHYFIAPVLEAWLEENFLGEDKLHPWVAAVETLAEKMTGRKVSIWPRMSPLLSDLASTVATSLKSGDRAGLTPAGATAS
jgi:hypothetical protein